MSSEPGESDTAVRIGRLYALIGDSVASAQYHRRALYEGIKTEAPKTKLAHLYLWLARWEMQREREGKEGDLRLAEEYLEEVMGVQEEREVRRSLLLTSSLLMLISRDDCRRRKLCGRR